MCCILDIFCSHSLVERRGDLRRLEALVAVMCTKDPSAQPPTSSWFESYELDEDTKELTVPPLFKSEIYKVCDLVIHCHRACSGCVILRCAVIVHAPGV